ncbi:integrase core domain-containing protein, partial [Burkholderia pyrrocinia]|uniref:integrase core domain-containing protein n=1 Tax=Burkholderia pyrrocinia TaxID=60550 RepID=UPI00158C284E
ATQSRARPDIEEVTTGSVLLCAIRREVAQISNAFDNECLNEHWFVSMRHAKRLIEEWRIEYNTERPHSSLGYLTPAQFARAHDAKQQFLTSDSNCSSD